MQRAIIIFCLFFAIIAFFSYLKTSRHSGKVDTSTASRISPSSDPGQARMTPDYVITYNDKRYALFVQEITNPEKLELIPNFSEKKSSGEIMQENNCKYGANAGFYTKENKPLGLFYSSATFLNDQPHNTLFLNGFVYRLKNGTLIIAQDSPSIGFDFIFQSGPLFTPETNLNIINDEYARRIVIVNSNNRFFLLAITEEKNLHSGPLLADLPKIVSLIPNSIFTIQNSIFLNLDGGSASAFIQEDGTKLSELVAIGSFLCGK